MVALPGQLFYSTQIPACLWFLARDRKRRGEILFIDARSLGTMVDRTHRELTSDDIARIAGTYHAWRSQGPSDPAEASSRALTSRHSAPENPLPLEEEASRTPSDLEGEAPVNLSPLEVEAPNNPSPLEGEGRVRGQTPYTDVPGFCKSASLDEVRRQGHVLTPGRYVGAPPQPDDGEPFEAKMQRLVADLRTQQAEGARLDAAIAENLKAIGFGGETIREHRHDFPPPLHPDTGTRT